MNSLLGDAPVRFIDVAEEQAEAERLRRFAERGGHDSPAYALSPGMEGFDLNPLRAELHEHRAELDSLMAGEETTEGFHPESGYFGYSDAAALYLMVRRFRPRRVIEVGCGNSTRVTRTAIRHGGFDCRLTAIDPYPRRDIEGLVDRFEQSPVEDLDPALFGALEAGDILFIDSSHQMRVANDVAFLFCRILPQLAPGVVIHVHDVFLPFEYPGRFFTECPSWAEQYMLHGVMQGGGYEILWPGYYLQETRPDELTEMPYLGADRAQSFWIAKR